MLDDLTDDQRAVHAMALDFAAAELAPDAAAWDRERVFPEAALGRAAAGGAALGRVEAALVFEALAGACPSTAAYLSIHNMVASLVDRFGDGAQRARFLPDLVTMQRFASFCLTEPGAGSDAASLATRARRDGDAYVLDDTKAFVSGGGRSDLYLVMARTGGDGARGISAFLVERDRPGLAFGRQERKLGWHSQPTAMVHIDGCRVPAANRLGGEGEGFRIAMAGLDGGRVNIAACSLGSARACLDRALAHVRERRQFGRSLADLQAVQFTLADMAPSSRPPDSSPWPRPKSSMPARPEPPPPPPWQSASPRRWAFRWSTGRCNSWAATAISRTTASSATSATHASTASSRAPTRSCAS